MEVFLSTGIMGVTKKFSPACCPAVPLGRGFSIRRLLGVLSDYCSTNDQRTLFLVPSTVVVQWTTRNMSIIRIIKW